MIVTSFLKLPMWPSASKPASLDLRNMTPPFTGVHISILSHEIRHLQLLHARFFSATTGKAGFGRHNDDVSASLNQSLAEINPALKPNVVATYRDCLLNDWTWLTPRPYRGRTWSQYRYRANGGWPYAWLPVRTSGYRTSPPMAGV